MLKCPCGKQFKTLRGRNQHWIQSDCQKRTPVAPGQRSRGRNGTRSRPAEAPGPPLPITDQCVAVAAPADSNIREIDAEATTEDEELPGISYFSVFFSIFQYFSVFFSIFQYFSVFFGFCLYWLMSITLCRLFLGCRPNSNLVARRSQVSEADN